MLKVQIFSIFLMNSTYLETSQSHLLVRYMHISFKNKNRRLASPYYTMKTIRVSVVFRWGSISLKLQEKGENTLTVEIWPLKQPWSHRWVFTATGVRCWSTEILLCVFTTTLRELKLCFISQVQNTSTNSFCSKHSCCWHLHTQRSTRFLNIGCQQHIIYWAKCMLWACF